MSEKDLIFLDNKMSEIRRDLLSDIYQKKEVNKAFLNVTDLDIYSKDSSFFSKIGKAIRVSLLDENIVLTNEQEECLEILTKENLFISAPTSFGKTFLALEHIARNSTTIDNVVFVVPTIALMNELRKKCYSYFKNTYTIITSDSELEQYYSENKKIIIVVPERINAKLFQRYLNEHGIDFLVYDEIYKLNADNNVNNTRLIKMNYIYKYLIEKSSKILLLGPFIKNVDFSRSKIHIRKFITNLNLVYNDIIFDEDLKEYFGNPEDKRFVYFDTPKSIIDFLKGSSIKNPEINFDSTIVEWLSYNIHPDWYYIDYLKQGIGIHHGKTPIFLRKYIENEYANGNIHTILCTSTLVEGINTPTNSLVVYDKPRGVFELNNLIGRVGRLNIDNPKKGKIYIKNREIWNLYNPDIWIDLNILYEDESILTKNTEDECLYLSKEASQEVNENIDALNNQLLTQFGISYSDVIEMGIEFKILQRFVMNFEEITKHSREASVIYGMRFKLLSGYNKYLSGLQLNNYSFGNSKNIVSKYLSFDAVYFLLVSNNGVKSVIKKFTDVYPNYKSNDINLFIDTLFKIDEFIKFEMMKIISIYDLFDSKIPFDSRENRAFIQSIGMIKNYSNSNDGYERILTDIGFPQEDILAIRNKICDFSNVKGTENKLKQLKKEEMFRNLSPFGKRIIKDL
ncbi:DEAD/DEAH box helicase [Listeria marthii]|uniref:DEAD/DEAH box helicase n=1 Tax=Listeria marthii TaxID=529731 RepID=UPI0016237B6C|nr:DEAD/DEAH box helicase [Listeria marthii]MBC2000393.1 DEAD/DEAH box helicase [Listeria marthii]